MKGFRVPIGKLAGACGLAAILLVVGCGGGPGSSASANSSSTTTTPPTPISFAANSIVFGAANSQGPTYNVDEMSATGTNVQTVAANLPDSIVLFALNPAASGQYVIAADPTGAGLYGIYLSTNLAMTAPVTIVAPKYSYVSSLCVTRNGADIVYSAADASGVSNLFVVPTSGGTPVNFGVSDGSCVNPSNDDTIAYLAPLLGGGADEIFLRSLSAGPSGNVTLISDSVANDTVPAYSPDGTKLAFCSLNTAQATIAVKNLSTNSLIFLPNPPSSTPQALAFSGDGASLVIASDVNTSGQICTQLADGSASPSVILKSPQLLGNYGVFWTDANGRLAGRFSGLSSASRRSNKRRR